MMFGSNNCSDKSAATGSNKGAGNGFNNNFNNSFSSNFNDGSQKNMPSIMLDIPALMANFLSVLSAPIFSQLPWKQSHQVVVQTLLESSSPPTPLSSRTIH